MKLKILAMMTTISVIAMTLVWAAAAPLTETAIPIYSGAVADRNAKAQAEVELKEDLEGVLLDLGLDLRSKSFKVYSCSAPAEEVFRFYLQKLSAKHVIDSIDPFDLEPGETSPVDYGLSFHELRDFRDSSSGKVFISGKQVRNTLAAKRKPYQSEKWVKWADFQWSVREKNGDLSAYFLTVDDRSFSKDYKTYKTKTWIEVHRQTYKSEEESGEDDDAELDAEVAAKAKAMKQPTEKELGAPVYPGSALNKEVSAGMSLGDEEVFYVFLANDPPAKVVAFYEQKLGKKADNNGGKYMIALKGKLPYPDEGIAIEPNLLGGAAKTMITFRKLLRK